MATRPSPAVDCSRSPHWRRSASSAFTMLLVHGLVDTPYWKNDLSLELWILAAVNVVSLKIVYNTSPNR